MSRINFTESNHPALGWGYEVYNSSGQNICAIRKVRIGRFMHWSMVVEFYHLVDELNHIWFSPSCQDEIRVECKRLNGMKKMGV